MYLYILKNCEFTYQWNDKIKNPIDGMKMIIAKQVQVEGGE